MKSRRLALAMLAMPVSALILSGCAQGAAQSEPEPAGNATADAIQVVATTNVYRDIAQRVGGEYVKATEVISSPAQDPHSYEPSARDKLMVSEAQLVLANGGGYDDFMMQLVSSLPADKQVHALYAVDSSPVPGQVEGEEHTEDAHAEESAADQPHEAEAHETAEEESHEGHDHAGYNEHIWFDLESMGALADALADELSALDPEHAAQFEANAGEFNTDLDGLAAQLAKAGLEGRSFAMTEPVPYHLLTDAGMVDDTPEGLSAAVEAGADIPPQVLKQLNDALQAGSIDLLAYNIQTEGPDSISIRSTAEAANVPVVEFAETMNTGETYIEWMGQQIDALSSAVNG